MLESWRETLYPIGFLANLLFGIRFFIQWLQSEKKKKSHFSLSFWHISLLGSVCLSFHSLIQLQYPICLINSCNAILYVRNLQIVKHTDRPTALGKMFLIFGLTFLIVTSIFLFQGFVSGNTIEWMRIPVFLKTTTSHKLPMGWHIFGCIGVFLFALRFWIYWFRAETKKSFLPKNDFWILSLLGSSIACIYFITIFDLVNIFSYVFGMIPYARNLLLIRKSRASSEGKA